MTLVDEDDAIGKPFGFFDIVSGEDDALTLAAHVPHNVPERLSILRINSACRFIEKNELRIVDKGARERQSLFLPPGQMLEPFMLLLFQTEISDELAVRQTPFIESAQEEKNLPNRELREEYRVLKLNPDALLVRERYRLSHAAEIGQEPPVFSAQSHDDVNGCGFPRSVRAQQGDDLSCVYGKA